LPSTTVIGCRLPNEDAVRLRGIADLMHVPVSQVVAAAVNKHVLGKPSGSVKDPGGGSNYRGDARDAQPVAASLPEVSDLPEGAHPDGRERRPAHANGQAPGGDDGTS
jgi:hypothetical protein